MDDITIFRRIICFNSFITIYGVIDYIGDFVRSAIEVFDIIIGWQQQC